MKNSSHYYFSKIERIVARVACYYCKKYEKEYDCIFSFGSTGSDKEFILSIIAGDRCGRIPVPEEFKCKNMTMCIHDYSNLPDDLVSCQKITFSVEGLVKFKDIYKVYKSLLKKSLVKGIGKEWNYLRVI